MIDVLTSADISTVAAMELKYIDCPYSEKVLSEFLDEENTIAYKYCKGDVLVGYISGQTVLDECNVNNVVVDENYRRQGIASELLTAFINECRNRKVNFVFLEVATTNEAAKSLYQKFGFEPLFIRKNYYKDKDAAVMRKTI